MKTRVDFLEVYIMFLVLKSKIFPIRKQAQEK